MKYALAHIGLTVSNLEESIRFYEEAFAMHEVFRMYPKTDLEMILCFLQTGQKGCMITLIAYQETKGHEKFVPDNNDLNITFITDDFAASYQKHRAMGIVTIVELEKKIYYVSDPDGYEIAVVPREFHPAWSVREKKTKRTRA